MNLPCVMLGQGFITEKKKPLKKPLIKPSHEGRFTDWAKGQGYKCKNGVPMAAINAGLASKNKHVRSMATFAKNFR